MIKEIRYKNFKALRDAVLPLGRFTLIVGANGTGKTTALKALELIKNSDKIVWRNIISVSEMESEDNQVSISVETTFGNETINWKKHKQDGIRSGYPEFIFDDDDAEKLRLKHEDLDGFKMFSFDSEEIAEAVVVKPNTKLDENGGGLVGVLDQLRDSDPEKFEELNRELNKWLYEFDRIVFETPADGVKSFLLRTTLGKHKIKAGELSDGTLLALAFLTIAYLPDPPKIVAFEEPEKGIHPRLLKNIQEAMYRLAYPENYGEKREPIQVVATTHSPYLLDLYKEHPEEIVIASKDENGVHFERLIDKPHYEEVIQDAPLGEIWYSGILGGVPAHV